MLKQAMEHHPALHCAAGGGNQGCKEFAVLLPKGFKCRIALDKGVGRHFVVDDTTEELPGLVAEGVLYRSASMMLPEHKLDDSFSRCDALSVLQFRHVAERIGLSAFLGHGHREAAEHALRSQKLRLQIAQTRGAKRALPDDQCIKTRAGVAIVSCPINPL